MRKLRFVGYKSYLVAFGIGMLLLSGCAGAMSFVGQTARQEDKVVLMDSGPHEGRWETNDVILDYIYSNQSAIFDINGTVKLSSGLTTGYRDISGFAVRINFLDDEKKVLDSQILYLGGSRAPILTWRYAKQFNLPDNAVAFNISYRGTVLDASGAGDKGYGDTVKWDFWRHP